MVYYLILLFLTITLTIIHFSSCETDITQEMTRLRHYLLHEQDYDPGVRPVKNFTRMTNISVSAFLIEVTDIDLRLNALESSAGFVIKWTDEYLQWLPDDYSGIRYMIYDPYKVWTPELFVPGVYGPGRLEDAAESRIVGNYKGNMTWSVTMTPATSCNVDLSDYPQDSQTCFITIYLYDSTDRKYALRIKNISKKAIYGPLRENRKWLVTSKGVLWSKSNFGENFQFIRYKLVLERRNDIHTHFITLPYFCASLFGFSIFLSPIGSKKRYLFGILSCFILVSLHVFMYWMATAYSKRTPYPVRCTGINIALVAISLLAPNIVYQIIKSLASECPPLPSLIVNHLKNPLLNSILMLSDDSDGIDNHRFNQRSQVVIKEWMSLIRLVDRILLILYIIAFAILHS